MHRIFSSFCFLLVFLQLEAQVSISTDDFKDLDGSSWEGTLTYLDYQSGELTDIATTMQFRTTKNSIEQNIHYVWEPHKKVQSITIIKKRGKVLGKQKVVSLTKREDGTTILTTQAKGKDDDRKAIFTFTYEFNHDFYQVTKEVQLEGSNERFMRNRYKYQRIP